MIIKKYLAPWAFVLLIALAKNVGAYDCNEAYVFSGASTISKFSPLNYPTIKEKWGAVKKVYARNQKKYEEPIKEKWSNVQDFYDKSQKKLGEPVFGNVSLGTNLTVLSFITFVTSFNMGDVYRHKLDKERSKIYYAAKDLSEGSLRLLKMRALTFNILTKGANTLAFSAGLFSLATFYVTPTIPVILKMAVAGWFGVAGGLGMAGLSMMRAW